MSYLTKYQFTIVEGSNKLINKFRNFSDSAKYAFDRYGDSDADSWCEWYSYEEDIIKFSKTKPDNIFKISGIGQGIGDAWELYVKDGHTQVCVGEFAYPEFDKDQLLLEIRDEKINSILK